MKRRIILPLLTLCASLFVLLVFITSCGGATVGTGELAYADRGDYYLVSGIGTYTGTHVVIPAEHNGKPVQSIGPSAFKDNTEIMKVTLGKNITSINQNAFSGCSSLESVESLSGSINLVGTDAFKDTPFLAEGTEGGGVLYLGNVLIAAGKELAGEYRIADGTLTLAYDAFRDCTALTRIVIPEKLFHSGRFTFYGCTSLAEAVYEGGIGYLGDGVFYGCTSLTAVNLPTGCTSIGARAFAHCTALTEIALPDGLKKIGDLAFSQCTALSGIALPANVTSVGNEAFYGCRALAYLTFGDALTSIGIQAFAACPLLPVPELPASVTVGAHAFDR